MPRQTEVKQISIRETAITDEVSLGDVPESLWSAGTCPFLVQRFILRQAAATRVTFTGVCSGDTAGWNAGRERRRGSRTESAPAAGCGSVPLLLRVIRSFYEKSCQFVRNPSAGFDLQLVLAM